MKERWNKLSLNHLEFRRIRGDLITNCKIMWVDAERTIPFSKEFRVSE